MSVNRRDFLRYASLASASLTGTAATTLAAKPAAAAPTRSRVLLRGGYIVTMDQGLGDLRGDVLLDKGKIGAIGKNLAASDAEIVDASDAIVIPGFIDTHRHTWESQLRQVSADWTLFEYLRDLFGKFGTNFRPDDVYAGTLIGRLSALNGGITTMLDWSHIMNTPQHADAAIEALRDSGGRSVFAMGWPQTPEPLKWIQQSTLDVPDDIRRVRKQYFSSNTGLVSLQMAGRGPTFAVMDQVAKDLATARDLGLHTTMHVGGGGAIVEMYKAKLLGPDVTWVHLLTATDEELDAIKDSGCTASVSPAGEEWHTGWHGPTPATARLLSHGITPSLSPDTEAFAPGDMFSVMRETLGAARYSTSNPRDANAQPPVPPQQYNAGKIIPIRKILEMATVAGAAPVERDGQIGVLSPGKQADIVMLRMSSLNYFPVNDAAAAVVMSADTSCVDAVFVAGIAVKFNGKLVNQTIEKRALRLALESRDWLYARAGLRLPEGLEKQKV